MLSIVARFRSFGILLLLCISTCASSVTYVNIIERDYTGNHTASDRFWFYKNLDGTPQNPANGYGYFPSLEYEAGRSFQIPGVVYTKSSPITVSLKFRNVHPNTITANLNFTAFRLAVPPGPGRPNTTYITLSPPSSQQFTIAGNGGTAIVPITINGLPSYVTLGSLEWQGTLTAVSGVKSGTVLWNQPIGWATWESIFITDISPTSTQATPWLDVLRYACSFAHSFSGQVDVARNLTQNFFEHPGWTYNPAVTQFWLTPNLSDQLSSTTHEFALLGCTTVLDTGSNFELGCPDVSGFLQIMSNALGHPGQSLRAVHSGAFIDVDVFGDPFINTIGFTTNKLYRKGGSGVANPSNYNREFFSYHQYVVLGGKVYDATTAHLRDLSGANYYQPAKEWSVPAYRQTVYSLDPHLGLVYCNGPESQGPSNSSVFDFSVIISRIR